MARKLAQSQGPDELATALSAVEDDPRDMSAWDRAEEIAERVQRLEDVATSYVKVMTDALPAEAVAEIGQRGVRFFETWFGDGDSALPKLLERVLTLDPHAEWAFERLTVAYTVTARFDELLDAYDRAIENADQTARRMKLLEEGAQVAKDFANAPDRAIAYLTQLHALEPDNQVIGAALERLLERQERWGDLVTLWSSRLDVLPERQARDNRLRIATLQTERLGQHGEALEQVKQILATAPEHRPTHQLLEKIMAAPGAPAASRMEALGTLRQRLIDERRPKDLVRVLELGLTGAEPAQQRALLRELSERLIELGDDARALKHQAALVAIDPLPTEQETLRMLATRTRSFDVLADALAQAADACAEPATAADLRVQAARVCEESLGDDARAIELYAAVFAAPPSTETALDVGRRLVPLLERTDRAAQTLDVLARLSELEPDETMRRALLGKVARLAEKVGDRARAEHAWAARIGGDTDDVEALDALIRSAEKAAEHARLAELLEVRIKSKGAAERRRADLVRVAQLYAGELKKLDAAIDAWRRIEAQFGQDMESVTALTDLLSRAERWQELADALSQAAAHQIARFTELQTRLGDAYRQHLDQAELAAERYRSALQVEPRDAAARAGQRSLLDDARCRGVAIASLADAYARTDEWKELLALLEARVSLADSATARAAVLVEAAVMNEQRAEDAKAALECYARAFAFTPDDRSVEREIRRLAEKLGAWDAIVKTYRDTIASMPRPTPRVAELRHDEGRTIEQRLGDLPGALEAYAAAAAIAPDRVDLAMPATRLAAKLGRWADAAGRAVECMGARNQVENELLEGLETAAELAEAWDALAESFTAALSSRSLPQKLARALYVRIAAWHSEQREDLDAAEGALLRAVSADAEDLTTLRALVDLQRTKHSSELPNSLLLLAARVPEDLDPLREAAQALGSAHDSARRVVLEQLYDRAAGMLRRGQAAKGTATAAECVRLALDELVASLEQGGEAARALALLVASATLPLGPEQTRADLRRAAELARGPLKDPARASALYRDLLVLDPRDQEARRELASLCEAADRLPDLLALRREELALTSDEARRVELRLEIARRLSELEARGGQHELLMQNLRSLPGHAATLDALTTLLDARGRHAELAELLTAQARVLAKQSQPARAAELLELAAVRYERELRDIDAAIATYRELHELAPESDASAALARLFSSRGQHAAAAKWLELRLGTVPPDTRAVTSIELGRAFLDAGQRDRARAALERALLEDPSRSEARELLAQIYREDEAFEPLAGLLSEWSARETDSQRRLELLREAATLYYDTLNAPERAVDVLQRAATLAPDDQQLGVRLADGLLRAGRHADARAVLERLIEAQGRKRSPERAELHYQLARVLADEGAVPAAFEQLDIATKMDLSHLAATHMLARLSQEQGDLDRAERVYRGLLMLVRRQGAIAQERVGSGEIFYELSAIARARGQEEAAQELLQSAMEAATQHDIEAQRFQLLLRQRGERVLLMRLLDARLSLANGPVAESDVLRAKAEVLADSGEASAALDALLRAISLTPDEPPLHVRARALARTAQGVDRYLDQITASADELGRRRDGDAKRLAARLTLLAGEAVEQDLGDLDRAAGLYAKVEASGEHVIDAWMAMARVAGGRGDRAEQRRVLQGIVQLEPERLSDAQRREALLTLAELELLHDTWREDGVATLERALVGLSDYDRTKQMLRRVVERASEQPALNALFERVARISHDELMLLEHFERLAQQKGASVDVLREGIELALRTGQHARAQALLERSAELARKLGPVPTWVLSGLADCKLGQHDVRGAMEALREALETAAEGEIEDLGRELARVASGPDGDLAVAAEAYEKLLERNRGERSVWQPLLDLYARMGDRAKLEAHAARCVDELTLPVDRAAVHMSLASFLIETAGDSRAAVPSLRAVLDEDAARGDARDLLISIYQQQGMHDELAEMLQSQFDRARDEQNLEAIADIGLRIGGLLGDRRREESLDAYRAALEWVPSHKGLMRALLERMGDEADPRERAETLEALLASEEGDEAGSLAVELYAVWKSLDEPDRAQSALESGLAKQPAHERVRDLLEACYAEREQWRPLAELFEREAARIGAGPAAVVRLKNAATFYREQLQDLNAAAAALRKALEIVPDDLSLSGELARNLAAAGQHDAAIADLTRLLDGHPAADTVRMDLLRVRAELYLDTEQIALGVVDLEEAYGIAPAELSARLIEALERLKSAAFTEGDPEAERTAVRRLVELHDAAGDAEHAREVLAEWVEQDSQDLESLCALRDRDAAAERWDDVISACERLLDLQSGEERAATVVALADAAQRAGRPAAARAGLERVYREEPTRAELRERLRALYEALDEKAALAAILLADASDTGAATDKVALLQRAAKLYLEVGDTAAALAPLSEAVKLEPSDFTTQMLVIDSNIQLGRSADADAALEAAIAVHRKRRTPELAVLYQRKGRLSAALGDVPEQIKWLNQAMEADRKSGELATELAEVSIAVGDYDNAMKALRMLTMMDDPRPMSRAMAFLKQAQIAFAQGDPRRAQHWARKAKSLDEGLEEADRFLAEIGG